LFCWSWMGKPSDPRLRLGCCNRHPRLHERCWIVAVARGAEKKYRKLHLPSALLHRVNGMVRLVSGTTILHCYICTYFKSDAYICFTIKMAKMFKLFFFLLKNNIYCFFQIQIRFSTKTSGYNFLHTSRKYLYLLLVLLQLLKNECLNFHKFLETSV
jgi:hypothetical protein